MTVLKAYFDGKVFVPDEPVNVPADCDLEVSVEPHGGSGRLKPQPDS
jgi:anti-sigma-K factor RskA